MEAKQQAAKPQAPVRAPFCLRLNALRALACISVIITHVVSFLGLIGKFRSLHYGGHIAVYFFFNLSGYLLSFSFIKEIQRRLNVKKETKKVSACAEKLESSEDQSSQVEIPIAETKNQSNSSLTDLFKKVKKSTLVSILCKYLWNRTWRLFPVYFGCWFVLKYFAVEEIPDRNIFPDTTWSDIVMLRAFPGHLWTMRIEMMFYYYVIPFYICALYIGFKLQKEGFETASKAIFMGLAVGLLYGGLLNLRIEESALNPVSKKHRLADMLPPFYFGMLAALANFAIEQKLIARQAAAKTATPQVQRTRGVLGKLEDLPKFVWPVLDKYKYSLIWTAVFTRIIFLNPGVFVTEKPDESWQTENMASYWYGIFILLNDTRGGFYKWMHPKPETKSTELHPSIMHKIIYYFGLWSYPIYLTHPIAYVRLAKYFPKTQFTVEFGVATVFICIFIGGVCDFVFDKIFTTKLMLGKVIPGINRLRKILF